jgi:hypothetical protein
MDDFLVSFSWSLGQQISDLLNNLGVWEEKVGVKY